MNLLKLGRRMTLGGAAVVVIGLSLGFWGLLSGMGQAALKFFTLTALGFVAAFVGVTLIVLLEPRNNPSPPD